MATFTAVLFPQLDGSYLAWIPALPECRAEGVTRASALANVAIAAGGILEALFANGRGSRLREDWSPARTVWVLDPRTGDTIPYVVAVERTDDLDRPFRGMAVLFPEVVESAADIDAVLRLVRPRLYQHLVGLVAAKRRFPVQDDQSAYPVRVVDPDDLASSAKV